MPSAVDAVRDWAATVASVSGVLSTICVFDVVQRATYHLRRDRYEESVSDMAAWMNRFTRLSGATHRVEGLEHVAPGQNYIVVSNHQSLLDIAMASEVLRDLKPRYVSKKELATGIPGVSYYLRNGGCACIDRKDPAQAHAAIEELGRHVAEDHWTAVIFPEGTRTRTGAMKAFRSGGLRTLVTAAPHVPILPLTTWGGARLFRHKMKPLVRNVELGFHLHPPVMAPSPDDEAAFEAFVQQLWRTIESALPEHDRRGEA